MKYTVCNTPNGMIAYIETDSVDTAMYSIAECKKIDLKSLFIPQNRGNILLQTVHISEWSQLSDTLPVQNSLFDNNPHTPTVFLCNLGELEVTDTVAEYLATLTDLDIFFIRPEKISPLKAELTAWQHAGLPIIKPKIMVSTITTFLHNAAVSQGVSLSQKALQSLWTYTQHIRQSLDAIDVASLSNDPEGYILTHYSSEVSTPLYMLGLSGTHKAQEAQRWFYAVPDIDELQLGLSLVFGKLQKNKELKPLARHIIALDDTIKTRSGINPLLWWKLFWWNYKHD